MAYLRKTQVEEIIKNAPPGTTPAGIVAALREQGHTLEGMAEMNRVSPNEARAEERGLLEKAVYALGNFTGVTKLGEGIAASINKGRNAKLRDDSMKQTEETRNDLIKAIQKNRAEGVDTTRLENALAQLEEQARITGADFKDLADLGVTNRDVIGSAVRTAGTIASFGQYGAASTAGVGQIAKGNVAAGLRNQLPGLAAGAATPSAVTATTIGRGIAQGAAKGAKVGATGGSIFGAIQSLGLGIQDEEATAKQIAGATVGGAVAGGISGGVLGGIIGGIGGGFKARANMRAELERLVPEANTPHTERMKAAANELVEEVGDSADEIKVAQAHNRIVQSQAMPIDDAIAAGDITPDQVYSDVTRKILKPEVAKGRVLDIRLKLNAVEDGLGDAWASNINTNSATYDDIVQSGLNALDDHARAKAIPVPGNVVERPGQSSATAAPFKVDPKTGKIVDDIDAKTLMKTTGLPADDVAVIKSGTSADKRALKRMVDMANGTADDPLARVTQRPEAVAGETALKRVKLLREQLDDAGRSIDRAVRTDLAGKKVDTTPIYKKWVASLADEGIEVLDDGTLKATENSRFYKNTPRINEIKKIHDQAIRLNGTQTPAARANAVKNQLDEILDWQGRTDGAISSSIERIGKGLRANTDGLLDDTFTAYNTANTRYATAKRGLQEIESVLGKNYAKEIGLGEASDELVSQRLGTILRRLHSNAPESAIRLTNALDETAYKLNVPVKDSVTAQSYYATIIEDLYPENVQRNSLRGQVTAAVREGGGRQKMQGLRNFADRPLGTTVDAAIDFVDVDQTTKQAALEKYVEQLLNTTQ